MHPFNHVVWLGKRLIGQPARHKCTPRRDRPNAAPKPKFPIGRGHSFGPADPPKPSAPAVGVESTQVIFVSQRETL